jgi:tripartite-type tricarboxylate transporter receptor subunit TctC
MKAICGVAALSLLLIAGAASAQTSYPDRQVRMLVGFAAGGPADIAARIVADGLSEAWGKPVVVENLTGAAGNVATDRVAKSAPDGYTLVMAASSSIVTNVSLYDSCRSTRSRIWLPFRRSASRPTFLRSTTTCRPKAFRSWSRSRGRGPARSPSARPVSGPRSIWPANSSRQWRASTSNMCPIGASHR